MPGFGPVRQPALEARDEQHPSMMRGDDVFLIDDPTVVPQRQEDYGAFVQHALNSFDAEEGEAGPAEDGETDAVVNAGFGEGGKAMSPQPPSKGLGLQNHRLFELPMGSQMSYGTDQGSQS